MKWRRRRGSGRLVCGATFLFVCIYAQLARADCSLTNLGIKPLPETGLGAYKGYPGGLYPNYANNRPPAHFAAGVMIDRKSTRLNSSHIPFSPIPSSACKKKQNKTTARTPAPLRRPRAPTHPEPPD